MSKHFVKHKCSTVQFQPLIQSKVPIICRRHTVKLNSLHLIIIIAILECWKWVASRMEQLDKIQLYLKLSPTSSAIFPLYSGWQYTFRTWYKALTYFDRKLSGLIYLSLLRQTLPRTFLKEWHPQYFAIHNRHRNFSPSDLASSNQCIFIALMNKFSASKCFVYTCREFQHVKKCGEEIMGL